MLWCPVITRRGYPKFWAIPSNLWYYPHLNPKFKCSSHRLAVVIAQTIEARCKVENEDVVGAAPTGIGVVFMLLINWGRVTHICVNNLAITGSDNGFSPGRRQAIIWSYAGILLIWQLGTNLCEILIGNHINSFKKMSLKLSSAKFCLGLKVLRWIAIERIETDKANCCVSNEAHTIIFKLYILNGP